VGAVPAGGAATESRAEGRCVAVPRGSKSQPGTEVAALFYSLIETAKLGEDPGDYLLRVARAAIEQPGTVTLPKSVD
jgi:hypothetical protein